MLPPADASLSVLIEKIQHRHSQFPMPQRIPHILPWSTQFHPQRVPVRQKEIADGELVIQRQDLHRPKPQIICGKQEWFEPILDGAVTLRLLGGLLDDIDCRIHKKLSHAPVREGHPLP